MKTQVLCLAKKEKENTSFWEVDIEIIVRTCNLHDLYTIVSA